MADDVAEPAVDPQASELLQWGATIAYWILYPVAIALYYAVYYLAFALLFVLKLLYRPLEFILLPVFYLLRFIGACIVAPFHFLARFETLYIYLGIGAIVGCTLGVLLSLTYGSLKAPLGLDAPDIRRPVRTAKQFRQERDKRKSKETAMPLSPGHLTPTPLSLSDASRKSSRGRLVGMEMDSDF